MTSQRTGEPILSKHGVTQGRKSSTSLFSFAIRDIPKAVKLPESFLKGNHVLQLADDASILTTSHSYLATAFRQMMDGSDEEFMLTNLEKTFFLDLCKNPDTDPIRVSESQSIQYAENNSHPYLGMGIVSSNEIVDHIKYNLSQRKYNIKKYYDWLEINESTPIRIKLQVLDCCMMLAYLYGCECWWKIDAVANTLLSEERKILKRILQVKPNTPTDIIYTELNRCNIITRTKFRQFNFYERFKLLNQEDCIARRILDLCLHLDICKYYDSLDSNILNEAKTQMKSRLTESTSTYNARYVDITNCTYNSTIYNEYLSEYKRIIITKWRLSSHRLHIETGRSESPKTPRDERTCRICDGIIEDEQHALFECELYNATRLKHKHLFEKYKSVKEILNPQSIADAEDLGEVLIAIENTRKSNGLQHIRT